MHLFRITFLFVAIGAAWAQTAVAQNIGGRDSALPSEQLLNRNGLTKSWWSHATINSSRDRMVHMVVDEAYLFLQSSNGSVTAFDAESGKLLWTRQVGVPDRAVYEASSNDTLLFIVNGMQLYAVYKKTGETKWKLTLPGMPSASPQADDQQVYVGFVDGSVYAFNIKETEKLHAKNMLPRFSDSAVNWRYRTSKTISSAPVPAETVVAFSSRNGSLYSVSKDFRTLQFQFETEAPLTAPVVRFRNRLLLASEDSNFYSIDVNKGTLIWKFTAGTVIRRAPVLVGKDVFLFPEMAPMRKLSAETGVSQWSVPHIKDFLSATPRRIYVTDQRNNLVILDSETGEQLGRFPLGSLKRHLANDRSDRIYLATETGLVVCLREREREFAHFHKHPERQPILPDITPEGAVPPSANLSTDEADGSMKEESPAEEEPAEKPEAEMEEAAPTDENAPPEAEEPPPAETPAEEEMKEEPAEEKPAGDEAPPEEPASEEEEKPAA